MPQLNPAPWFTILTFSWAILLVVIPPKVLAHTHINDPSPQSTETPKMEPWNWPWH